MPCLRAPPSPGAPGATVKGWPTARGAAARGGGGWGAPLPTIERLPSLVSESLEGSSGTRTLAAMQGRVPGEAQVGCACAESWEARPRVRRVRPRALAMARRTLQRARAALALLALGTARGARALDLCGVQTQGTVVVRAGEPATLACTYLVPGGSSLVLEPGAVVLAAGAAATAEAHAPLIIISRGARIDANGTEEAPITFASSSGYDPTAGRVTARTKGLWGGIVVLGRATINVDGNDAEARLDAAHVEGLPAGQGAFGGIDDNDSSGVLAYVRVYHTGAVIGTDVEPDALLLAGVGRGTEMHHIEVAFAADDALSFSGGVLNIHHIAVADIGDDAIDLDMGARVAIDRSVVVPASHGGDRIVELDSDRATPMDEPIARVDVLRMSVLASGDGVASRELFGLRHGGVGAFRNILLYQTRVGDSDGPSVLGLRRCDGTQLSVGQTSASSIQLAVSTFLALPCTSVLADGWPSNCAAPQRACVVHASEEACKDIALAWRGEDFIESLQEACTPHPQHPPRDHAAEVVPHVRVPVTSVLEDGGFDPRAIVSSGDIRKAGAFADGVLWTNSWTWLGSSGVLIEVGTSSDSPPPSSTPTTTVPPPSAPPTTTVPPPSAPPTTTVWETTTTTEASSPQAKSSPPPPTPASQRRGDSLDNETRDFGIEDDSEPESDNVSLAIIAVIAAICAASFGLLVLGSWYVQRRRRHSQDRASAYSEATSHAYAPLVGE